LRQRRNFLKPFNPILPDEAGQELGIFGISCTIRL
jgi:hypothetical protein